MAPKPAPKQTAWERRNARARAEGFKNYYEKRTREKPGAPKPSKETLRRRRGHAGARDLEKIITSGRVELVNVVQTGYDPPTFDVLCILEDGSQRSFTLRGEAATRRFRASIDAAGVDAPQLIGSPKGRAVLADALEVPADDDTPATFTDDDIPF